MPQLDVQIMGQGYVLACPAGGESALRAAVGRVDEAMCKIRDAGKIKARDRIAVLAALNLAFDAPAAATAAPTATPEPTDLSGADARLKALIAKLDQALASDGQLL